MSALNELLTLPARKDNPYLKEWMANAGRVVGVTCTYAPEEIIYAAGLLPYRMEARGCADTDLADVYFHRFNCTFARSLLQAGLAGDYKFLDGFCVLNGCEQIRRLYEVWQKAVRTPYQYMITIPHTISDAGLAWYREEISNFKENLVGNFSGRLTEGDLWHAIRVYNETRRLVQELYDLRKAENPPITGADAARIVLSAYIMPREKYNGLLREALKEIRARKGISGYKARLLIGGAALDDPQLMELVEGQGGMIVSDTLCFGTRNFGTLIEENGGNPLDAIAKHYYNRNPCPRMQKQFPSRLRYTEDMAKGAKVDGVILERIVFCDSHGVDAPMLAERLEEQGIPTLVLEREYALSDVGRLKTRVEAFLERIARG
ncbi:MAG: 2-hydroxyacyl-CoA dehydratase family protein [bacterium]